MMHCLNIQNWCILFTSKENVFVAETVLVGGPGEGIGVGRDRRSGLAGEAIGEGRMRHGGLGCGAIGAGRESRSRQAGGRDRGYQ